MPRVATVQDWLMLFALTVFWGTSFMFIELALVAFPPAVLVALRIALGAGALLLVLRAGGVRVFRRDRPWKHWLVIALLGVALPMQLTAWGQQHIDSAQTGVLMAISPVFVYTLAHFFLPGERFTVFRALGFLTGFTGVVLVIGPRGFFEWSDNRPLWGALAILGAALSYSLNTVYARRVSAGDARMLAAGMMVVATGVTVPLGLAGWGEIAWPPNLLACVAVAVLGIVSTGLASVFYFRLVQGPGPGFVTLVTYVVPGWAVLAGGLVLGESLGLEVYLGLALILGGVGVSEFGARLWRRLTPARIAPTS